MPSITCADFLFQLTIQVRTIALATMRRHDWVIIFHFSYSLFTDACHSWKFVAKGSRGRCRGRDVEPRTFDDMVEQLNILAEEFKKVAREIGTEDKLGVPEC